jgi:hypothetical protein
LARTALFDIHSVASVLLPPIREDRLSPPPSAADPSKVTLAAPVAAPLETTEAVSEKLA